MDGRKKANIAVEDSEQELSPAENSRRRKPNPKYQLTPVSKKLKVQPKIILSKAASDSSDSELDSTVNFKSTQSKSIDPPVTYLLASPLLGNTASTTSTNSAALVDRSIQQGKMIHSYFHSILYFKC